MDTRTGQIYEGEQLKDLIRDAEAKRFLKEMQISPTRAQMKRRPPRVGRNEPCPCGSGKKFKQCCYTGSVRPEVAQDTCDEIEGNKHHE